VVEDDPADSFVCERALADSPYQALTARSSAQARAALKMFTPVAILLDLVLAGEESWRLLIELSQDDATHDIPVIVISSTQEEMKARNLGAEDYLGKPAAAAEIVRAIDRATGRDSVRRVLVVDDDEVSRYLVRQLLPRSVFDVSEAATGQDALEQGAQNRPDVVLVDLNMPTMDGYEFLERWSGLDGGGTPAIVLTSLSIGAEQRARLAQVSQVVSKSDLSSDALVAAIETAIAQIPGAA